MTQTVRVPNLAKRTSTQCHHFPIQAEGFAHPDNHRTEFGHAPDAKRPSSRTGPTPQGAREGIWLRLPLAFKRGCAAVAQKRTLFKAGTCPPWSRSQGRAQQAAKPVVHPDSGVTGRAVALLQSELVVYLTKRHPSRPCPVRGKKRFKEEPEGLIYTSISIENRI